MKSINRRSFLASSAALAATATTSGTAAAANCAPRHGFTREKFLAYIDAFNNNRNEEVAPYYDEDVVLVIAGTTELRGRQAIFDFYKTVKTQTKRTIQVNKVIINDEHMAVELQSEFLALEDVPDFTAGPMKKGGRIFINTFVLYDFTEDGKFKRMRSAEFNKIDRQLENQDA
jgi:hypothetical protein